MGRTLQEQLNIANRHVADECLQRRGSKAHIAAIEVARFLRSEIKAEKTTEFPKCLNCELSYPSKECDNIGCNGS